MSVMGDARPVSQVMVDHPAPWRYTIFNGAVTMLDAKNVEVPLFTVLNVTVAVSRAMAAQSAQAEKVETPA
jgi:hypothetical protein